MSDLDEYHQNLMADIRREADASGIFPVEAFFDRMTERLTEAEVPVRYRCYDDMVHGFFGMGVLPDGLERITEICVTMGEMMHEPR